MACDFRISSKVSSSALVLKLLSCKQNSRQIEEPGMARNYELEICRLLYTPVSFALRFVFLYALFFLVLMVL